MARAIPLTFAGRNSQSDGTKAIVQNSTSDGTTRRGGVIRPLPPFHPRATIRILPSQGAIINDSRAIETKLRRDTRLPTVYVYTGCSRRLGPNLDHVSLRSNRWKMLVSTYVRKCFIEKIQTFKDLWTKFVLQLFAQNRIRVTNSQ